LHPLEDRRRGALVQLVEKVSPEELPLYRQARVPTVQATVPHENAITVRELADMRSGLFNYTTSPAFVRAWFTAPRRMDASAAARLQLQEACFVPARRKL
jgi:CubicO group peptidase (beta-lactamase class C family)